MRSREGSLNRANFLARVREYLSADAAAWETDAEGSQGRVAPLARLEENVFFLFDPDFLQALSHAVEDVGLEDARGHLVAALQDFGHFAQVKERYWQLAATLDRVDVLGAGRKPGKTGRVHFFSLGPSVLRMFRIVLYRGHGLHALLLCRQVDESQTVEKRRFVGCFTFSRSIVRRVEADLNALMQRKQIALTEFQRLRAIDHAAKRIRAQFNHEMLALDAALRKLRTDPSHFSFHEFASALDHSLARLRALRSRLPPLLEPQPSTRGSPRD